MNGSGPAGGMNLTQIGPIQIQNVNESLELWLPQALQSGLLSNRHVHFVNAHVMSEVRDSILMGKIFSDFCSICFLDSRPIEMLLRKISKKSSPLQVRGIDFLRAFIDCDLKGTSHYFLGSTEHVLSQFIAIYESKLNIAGIESPPYLEWDHMDKLGIYDRIRKSGAQFVWVSLGTPKQDFAAREIQATLGVTTIAIGAALDFVTLEKREAPRIVQRFGLEWLFRLFWEPRRLWKRYSVGNIIAILFLIKESR
jgi:N-acetylglucosaminyldiphosphoundecaprenol N-acetyl-beta-D-mannosaminyltransferase